MILCVLNCAILILLCFKIHYQSLSFKINFMLITNYYILNFISFTFGASDCVNYKISEPVKKIIPITPSPTPKEKIKNKSPMLSLAHVCHNATRTLFIGSICTKALPSLSSSAFVEKPFQYE